MKLHLTTQSLKNYTNKIKYMTLSPYQHFYISRKNNWPL